MWRTESSFENGRAIGEDSSGGGRFLCLPSLSGRQGRLPHGIIESF